MQIDRNFVTTVGLSNDERCLIYNRSAIGETLGFRRK